MEKEELADLKVKELQEREAKVAEREARCEEREAEMALSDKAAAAVNAALAEQVAALTNENEFLNKYIGPRGAASYTKGDRLRLLQWNLQWLTNGGDVQGALWGERLENVVNTIRRYKPDVVAIEEVKASENGNGLKAFEEIRDALEEHGYWGECSGQTTSNEDNTKNPECVGLLWRTRLAAQEHVTFTLLAGVNSPREPRRSGSVVHAKVGKNTFATAAKTLVGKKYKKAVEACAKAFREAHGENTPKQNFDRHLVLATLQTNLGKPGNPLHILIGHLATGKTGNAAEVNVTKELASRAWAAGAWLFVMADTNTHEAGNTNLWDDLDSLGGTRALPPDCHTNVFPHQCGKKAKPMRNDEILIPAKSWRVVSAETAPVCPAASAAWALAAAKLYRDSQATVLKLRVGGSALDAEKGKKCLLVGQPRGWWTIQFPGSDEKHKRRAKQLTPLAEDTVEGEAPAPPDEDNDGPARSINNQLTLRWSDHPPVIVEAELRAECPAPDNTGSEESKSETS